MISKLRNKILQAFLVLLLLASFSTPKNIKCLPPFKGLFNLLWYNDIGFGQALLESNFIKNVYIYADQKDPLRNLIRTLWIIFEEQGMPKESKKILPTKSLYPTGLIGNTFNYRGETRDVPYEQMAQGDVFGKLIALIYTKEIFNPRSKYKQQLIDAWNTNISKLLGEEKTQKKRRNQIRKLINKIIRALEWEKTGAYPPHTTESVLWAFFHHKFTQSDLTQEEGREVFKTCIQALAKMLQRFTKENPQINPSNTLNKSFDQLKKEKFFSKQNLYPQNIYLSCENTLKNIKQTKQKDIEAAKKILQKNIDILEEKNSLLDTKIMKLKTERKTRRKKLIQAKKNRLLIKKKLYTPYKAKIKRKDPKVKQYFKKYNNFKKIIEIQKRKIAQIKHILPQLEKEKEEILLQIKDLGEKAKTRTLIAGYQNKEALAHYDLYLHSLLKRITITQLPPTVIQSRFGYEYKDDKITKPVANCFEASLLDLVSILWYNPKTQTYDDAFLPQNILKGPGFSKLRKTLQMVHLADQHKIPEESYRKEYNNRVFSSLQELKKRIAEKVSEEEDIYDINLSDINPSLITHPALHQAWMNIVSGLSNIAYVGTKQNYEIRSIKENLIALFNYLFGLNAESLEDLNGKFDKKVDGIERTIKFSIQKIKEEKERMEEEEKEVERITITIEHTENDEIIMSSTISIDLTGSHTSLYTPVRDTASFIPYKIPESPELFANVIINSLKQVKYLNKEGVEKEKRKLTKRERLFEKRKEQKSISQEKLDSEKKDILLLKEILRQEYNRILLSEFAAQRSLPLFSLLTSRQLLNRIKNWPDSMLALVYYSLNLINSSIKISILRSILGQYNTVSQNIKNLMYAILQRITQEHVILDAYKIIFRTKQYSKDPILVEYLHKKPVLAIAAAIYNTKENKDHINWLEQQGIAINTQDEKGNTALMRIVSDLLTRANIATTWKYISALLELGANATIQNNKGETVLFKAVEATFNHLEIDVLRHILQQLQKLPPKIFEKLINTRNNAKQNIFQYAQVLHSSGKYYKDTGKKIIKTLKKFKKGYKI